MRTDRLPPLALAHLTLLDVPPAELVPLAARAGFAAVGLRLAPAHPGGIAYACPPGSAAFVELRARLDGEGVRVHDIEFVTIGPDFDPAALTTVLDQAAALGAARLSACGDDPDPARLASRFAALCDLAATYGLGVDLEWMGWRPVASSAGRAADRPRSGAPERGDPGRCAAPDPQRRRARRSRSASTRSLIRAVQLCDAAATAPATREAIVAEARGGRLLPAPAPCRSARCWKPCRRMRSCPAKSPLRRTRRRRNAWRARCSPRPRACSGRMGDSAARP